MKEVPKKELPAVSGGKRSDPYTDSVLPPVPDYPQIPIPPGPTDTPGPNTEPGCG
jgi:hypothetical protein